MVLGILDFKKQPSILLAGHAAVFALLSLLVSFELPDRAGSTRLWETQKLSSSSRIASRPNLVR